jgi:glycosyltransferase involved in cell wall biosynthesis
MNPTFSIITPTYNHEKYIGDCLESVLRQTVDDWEMIIVDDGSTDRTPEIIGRHPDARLRYIRKEHKGIFALAERYNEALALSRGEFIVVLEGDDFIPPNRLEIQKPSLSDPEVVLSHGKYAYVEGDGRRLPSVPFDQKLLRNDPKGSILKIFFEGFNPIGSQSVMIRRSALNEIGGFVQPADLPLVDYPTWMNLALKGRFAYIPVVLGFWRRHSDSVTMSRNKDIFNGFLNYCDDFTHRYEAVLRELNLLKFVANRGAMAHLCLSWIALSERKWETALACSRESWKRREILDFSDKMKVILGVASARIRQDLPSYFKATKRLLERRYAE